MEENEDVSRLRACIRDLAALSALPSQWMKCGAKEVIESVLAAVTEKLDADAAYARIEDPRGGATIEIARGSAATSLLARAGALVGGSERSVTTTEVGGNELRLAIVPLGEPCPGDVIIGASRPTFPSENESLLIDAAVNPLRHWLVANRAPEVVTAVEWRRLERANLEAALRSCEGRIYGDRGAAAMLGVKPSTLQSRLRAFGLRYRQK